MAEAEAPKFAIQGYGSSQSCLSRGCGKYLSYSSIQAVLETREDQPPECVISEIYTLNAMLEEHARIQSYHREPASECNLETVIAAIIL